MLHYIYPTLLNPLSCAVSPAKRHDNLFSSSARSCDNRFRSCDKKFTPNTTNMLFYKYSDLISKWLLDGDADKSRFSFKCLE